MSRFGLDSQQSAVVLQALQWVFGVFLVLVAIAAFTNVVGRGLLAALAALIGGLVFTIAALLTIPPTRDYITDPVAERTGVTMSNAVVAGIVAVAFVAGVGLLGGTAPDAAPADNLTDGTATETETPATTMTDDETVTDADTAGPTPTETDDTASTPEDTPAARETSTATATATPESVQQPTATPTATETATPRPTTTPASAGPEGGSDSDIVLNTIRYTGEGSDHDNPNNEWVEFENTGDGAVNVGGWRLEDDANHDYRFPDVRLRPGDTIRVYTGSGSNTDSELYWGSSRAIWNDGGDTVYLWNDDGELIVEFEYSGDEGGQTSP